jgi:hypothetical protein
MRNCLLLLILIFSLCNCNQENNIEYLGEFKATLPDMMKTDKSMPDSMLRAVGMMNWSLIIEEKELIIKLSGKEYLRMGYTIEGKSVIGQYNWGNKVVYYPFYFPNKNVAYAWGMELARVR